MRLGTLPLTVIETLTMSCPSVSPSVFGPRGHDKGVVQGLEVSWRRADVAVVPL